MTPRKPTTLTNLNPTNPVASKAESPVATARGKSKGEVPKRPNTATVAFRGNSITKIVSPKNPQHSTTNFKYERQLGQGAYAVVKLATDKSRNSKVAVKIYEKHDLSDPRRMKNVRREISILQDLDHPNIIKLIDNFETPKQVICSFETIINFVDSHGNGIRGKNFPSYIFETTRE